MNRPARAIRTAFGSSARVAVASAEDVCRSRRSAIRPSRDAVGAATLHDALLAHDALVGTPASPRLPTLTLPPPPSPPSPSPPRSRWTASPELLGEIERLRATDLA